MADSITFEELVTRSGLEFVRAVFAMRDRPAIISDLLDMQLVEAVEGRVTFSAEARPAFGNLGGTVHGGLTSTLLDSAMACAVHRTLEPGVGYGTVDLNTTFLRPVPTDGQRLLATGSIVHAGRTMVTAEGRVIDASGRLVAIARSTCFVRR